MKPLSGMLLYINLVIAIIWDFTGFILFLIGLIPGIQVIAIVGSVVLDVFAAMTDFIFGLLYSGYVKGYNVSLKVYQLKKIKEMLTFSKRFGAKNRLAQNMALQTQKINQYMLDQFSNYVMNVVIKKIQLSIITVVVEAVPWLGDFSPSWTIKAYLQLSAHRKTARELKIRNAEFENSLNKWRGSLRAGGVKK